MGCRPGQGRADHARAGQGRKGVMARAEWKHVGEGKVKVGITRMGHERKDTGTRQVLHGEEYDQGTARLNTR